MSTAWNAPNSITPRETRDYGATPPEGAGCEPLELPEESDAHEEDELLAGALPVSALGLGEDGVVLVVVPGSVLVGSVLVGSVLVGSVLVVVWPPVVEVPGSELWPDVVVEGDEDGVVVVLVVAEVLDVVSGQSAVPAAPTVDVVDWASTVASVWVWVRPGGTVALLLPLALVLAFVWAVPVVFTAALFRVL
jgi:hypothetical protein